MSSNINNFYMTIQNEEDYEKVILIFNAYELKNVNNLIFKPSFPFILSVDMGHRQFRYFYLTLSIGSDLSSLGYRHKKLDDFFKQY